MSQRLIVRTGLLWAGAMILGACASTTDIDPVDLPPEATIDDGIDYYSANLTAADPSAQELLGDNNNQWVTDEEGNRVYLLQLLRRGRMATYYVGDIRFIYANDNAEGPAGTAFGNTPVYVSQGGAPMQSPSVRGVRDDTYYQTRRGRIIYLPNVPRPATNSTSNNNQNNTSTGTQNSLPVTTTTTGTPSIVPVRPAPPAPAPRVTAPRAKPKPRRQPADGPRRPDR